MTCAWCQQDNPAHARFCLGCGVRLALACSLALAHDLATRPLAGRCHHGLGKLGRRAGQHREAREHLATAAALYREMGMKPWLEQAEAELAALS